MDIAEEYANNPNVIEGLHAAVVNLTKRIAEHQRKIDQENQRLDALVVRLRRGGASWSAVGLSLGVSKQAAQQRFGHLDPS